MDLKWEIRQ